MNPSTSNSQGSSTPAPNTRSQGPPPPQRAGSGSAPSTPTAYSQVHQDEIDAKRAGEVETRDKTLAEFMLMLDDYQPLIPDEITDYFLQKSGFETSDPRLKRLLSLAAQKFVSDIATDAFHYARIRTNATPATRGRPPTTGAAAAAAGPGGKDKTRTILTMDDLSASLAERGVNLKKPEYYQ